MEQNKALLERIRLFVLDLDGTIYLGDRLLPGAARRSKEKAKAVEEAAAAAEKAPAAEPAAKGRARASIDISVEE